MSNFKNLVVYVFVRDATVAIRCDATDGPMTDAFNQSVNLKLNSSDATHSRTRSALPLGPTECGQLNHPDSLPNNYYSEALRQVTAGERE